MIAAASSDHDIIFGSPEATTSAQTEPSALGGENLARSTASIIPNVPGLVVGLAR